MKGGNTLRRTCGFMDPETGVACKARPVPGEAHCTGCLWRLEQRAAGYERWLRDVARALSGAFGLDPQAALGALDLPGCPFAEWFGAGVRPAEAARRAAERLSRRTEKGGRTPCG